ncbi:MAG: biopolymer transporter ExbD [Bdellovibrionales bacterium]|nr:biopolymer transporter ExbD [Bdellovibrionales bacterium]
MSRLRSIRFRRSRRKHRDVELQLTSMMDVLVIILVFLLKSYSTSTNNFTTLPGLKLPISASQDMPPDSLHLIITPEGMTFENERIVEFELAAGSLADETGYSIKKADLAEDGRQIQPLYAALVKARDRAELLRAKSRARDESGNPLPFDGVLAIQADKRVHYDTIRKIMFTAATAGYKVFRLLALKRET